MGIVKSATRGDLGPGSGGGGGEREGHEGTRIGRESLAELMIGRRLDVGEGPAGVRGRSGEGQLW